MDTLNDLVTEEYRSRVPMKPGADAWPGWRIPPASPAASPPPARRSRPLRYGTAGTVAALPLRRQLCSVRRRADIYLEAARRLGTAPGRRWCLRMPFTLPGPPTRQASGSAASGTPPAEEDQAALKALADWYVRDLGDGSRKGREPRPAGRFQRRKVVPPNRRWKRPAGRGSPSLTGPSRPGPARTNPPGLSARPDPLRQRRPRRRRPGSLPRGRSWQREGHPQTRPSPPERSPDGGRPPDKCPAGSCRRTEHS